MTNVVIDVCEEPTAADWERQKSRGALTSDEWLLGLFVGVPITEQPFGEPHPNRIKIFRRPIEAVSDSVAEIREQIRDTILHELAHHFGYSEEDLERFEASRPYHEAEPDEPN